GPQARLPEDVVHVVLEPGLPGERGRELLVQLRPGQRRQDGVAGALEAVPRDEGPELLEIFLAPVRVHEKVARDTVAHGARDSRGFDRGGNVVVLDDVRETVVGSGLEAEEDVEVLRERAPGLEQLRAAADDVGPRLDEEPALADSALLQSLRELEAPGRVVPEE